MSGTETGPSKGTMLQQSKGLKREMSLSDVSMVLRGDLCMGLGNLPNRPIRKFFGAIQRLGYTNGEDGVVQILNEVPAHRNKKIATVASQGGDMVRKSGDFVDELGRVSNNSRRFNFRKVVGGSIHK